MDEAEVRRMRVARGEFERLELRCHSLLADVSLHDAWATWLAGGGNERTMRDVQAAGVLRAPPNLAVRGLFALRRALGRALGWERERPRAAAESYVYRLTDADRARSLTPPGTREGGFRTLYVFPHEALFELRNATVHAFLATALIPRAGGYRLYVGIYVKPVGLITPVYMALIDPFRRVVVYPALLRDAQAAWARAHS
jgi:hypothetical protein